MQLYTYVCTYSQYTYQLQKHARNTFCLSVSYNVNVTTIQSLGKKETKLQWRRLPIGGSTIHKVVAVGESRCQAELAHRADDLWTRRRRGCCVARVSNDVMYMTSRKFSREMFNHIQVKQAVTLHFLSFFRVRQYPSPLFLWIVEFLNTKDRCA